MSEHHHITPEFPREPAFREIEAIEQWSTRMEMDVPYDSFVDTIFTVAEEVPHRYAGILTREPVTGNVTSFTGTRFPRYKYGWPLETDDCEAAMRVLAQRFGVIHTADRGPSGMSRIVLGLCEGQHATGGRDDADYSIEDVRDMLGDEFFVQPAEVFVVRLDDKGKASHYSEDIAEVLFPTVLKRRVYYIGDAMKQERFSVEDFIEDGGWSYMVETRYCKEPDPVRPARNAADSA